MNEFPEKEPSQIGLAHLTMVFFYLVFDNAQV